MLLMQFGFDLADVEGLADAIARQAILHGPGTQMIPSAGLPRAVIEGPMECPNGRLLNVRTVWEQTSDTEVRFVTLVPLPA